MKVSYRREMKHNFMIIIPEEIVWRSYECQMMEENVIDGLLRFQTHQSDGEMLFYYEITSRQPLGRLLENRTISGEEIRRLIIGISNILDEIERFLLDESSILLEPDYIYVEPDSFRIWLCLVPGLKTDFPEAYGDLLEYILGKVNHQDKDSVVLAYGLYQETRKENYGMEDILRLLEQNTPQGYSDGHSTRRPEAEVLRELPELEEDLKADLKAAPKAVPKDKTDTAEHQSIWFRIKSFFTRRRKDKTDEAVIPKQPSWHAMFLEESEEPHVLMQASSHPEPAEAPSIQGERAAGGPPSSDFVPSGQGTVLLSDFTQKETLRKLRALDCGEADIVLSYYPFVIGKQENMVDHTLNHETVSRLHLRIDRIGEDYRIMDLNSTNGTTVRGRMLENNEAVPLNPGDEIQIAKYRYVFE